MSTLKIEDIVVGAGPEATAGSHLAMHYTGTLSDGSVFDSSHDRGEPLHFTLGIGQVIRGWDQGVLGMKQGGQRRLTIPSSLAYGSRGVPGLIPPEATLTFNCELVQVLRG